jgi:hypothetical protein
MANTERVKPGQKVWRNWLFFESSAQQSTAGLMVFADSTLVA